MRSGHQQCLGGRGWNDDEISGAPNVKVNANAVDWADTGSRTIAADACNKHQILMTVNSRKTKRNAARHNSRPHTS
eukprot:CAMPEP_0172561562 /NCGR_PEP_ID=MMETSP1067-20121228/93372_1 /TAXON_ID=265564 ORGANISM="Thalassiosira punctigera, Strain Tpunct2005C2" /NCGR_SAMPLE_ID=MMETSP1067 /ASSEMBLY_ACC=CAM_ASM_000444 /LENGTH=75 /DNA_ID=CAMNT_0013351627 /DNA_START=369 /DNA_END=593 /DNA_ORIENTATION=+